MKTITYDYSQLTKWIISNPKIRTYTNFVKPTGFSIQSIHYHIMAGTFMGDEKIKKIQETYGFTDKQIDKFFYRVKKLSK